MNNKKLRGRPKGIKKDDRLFISISSDLKSRFQKAVDIEGVPMSIKVCNLIREYTKKIEQENKRNEGLK